MQKSAYVAILLGLTGCSASEDVSSSDHAQVTGKDERVMVAADGSNVPSSLALSAFGRLRTAIPGQNCSVVHFGRGLALTAGSCVLPPGTRTPRITPILHFTPSPGQRTGFVSFDFAGDREPRMFDVLEAEISAERDYAVIDFWNKKDDQAIALDLGTTPSSTLSAIGYGTVPPGTVLPLPGENPHVLTFQDRCRRVAGAMGPTFLIHDCDTVDGMTGAAIIGTNGRVLGIQGGRGPGANNWATLASAIPSLKSYVLGSFAPPHVRIAAKTIWGSPDSAEVTIASEYPHTAKFVDVSIAGLADGSPVLFSQDKVPFVDGKITWTVDVAAWAKGSYVVRAVATDDFGLTTSKNSVFEVKQ